MITAAQRERILLGILILSPFAYLGSMLVERTLPPRADIAGIGEPEALRIATAFAAAQGVDTTGWESAVGPESNEEMVPVFRKAHSPALARIAAANPIRILLQSPNRKLWFRATLTSQGRVISFQKSKPKTKPVAVDLATARRTAEAFLLSRLGAGSPFQLEYREPSESGDHDQERTFNWRAGVPGVPRATAEFHVDMYGDLVTAERGSVSTKSSYFNPNSGWLDFLKTLAWIYVISLGLYSIVRYWRLAADQEVSFRRSTLAALAFVLLSALFALDPGYLSGKIGAELGPERIGLIAVLILAYCVMGAFFGVAYGAGEGGLRKIYPGKLTSLDAMLSGKFFSTNVARSVLVGGGIAGWLLLAQNALILALHGYRVGPDHEIVASAFYHLPLVALIGDRAADSVLQTTFGLLLPVALLRPRIRKAWVFFACMPLFSILTATLTAGDEALWATFFSVQLTLAAVVFVPFFTCDLLAAVCGVFAFRFVGAMIERGVVSAPWQHIFLWQVAPAGVAFLLAQAYFLWRGPTYEEFEVSPLYARNLAEHQSMEAEIDAARIAQLRLLPAAPPSIDGLSVAASCVPAREVGGDFFDFYELGSNRLAVFLAEGGSRELGSAMPIALAKGYLLHASGLDLAPAEVLRRLYEAMASALGGDSSMSVLYAVIDGRARTIRFARSGVSPRLSINGNPVVEELSGDASNPKAIHHGAAALALHDAIVFYTDGLAAQIAERKRQWTDQFLRKLLARQPDRPAADLLAALFQAAVRGKQHPPDDVTSVVVRIEQPAVNAMGVVA